MTAPTFVLGDAGGAPLVCDLEVFVRAHILVTGTTGAGKSTAIRRILEQTHALIPQLIIDTDGEFVTLRERGEYILVKREGGDIVADPRTAGPLAGRLLAAHASAILDIYDLKAAERIAFVRSFLEALMEAPRADWSPTLVILDEAQLYCPQGGRADSAEAVIDLMTRGRKRGLCAVLATQRLSALDKDACAQCNNRLFGHQSLDVDVTRTASELGLTKRDHQRITGLEPCTFFAVGQALSRSVVEVQIGPVTTTRPAPGSVVHRPPASAKLRTLVEQLAELPVAAPASEPTATAGDDIAALREQVASLRRQLADRQTPEAARRLLEFGETQIQQLLAAVDTRLGDIRGSFESLTNHVRDELARLRGELQQILTPDAARSTPGQVGPASDRIRRPSAPPATPTPAPDRTRRPSAPVAMPTPGRTGRAPQAKPSTPARPAPPATGSGATDLSPPKQRILDAMAFIERAIPGGIRRPLVAQFAGVSANSGSFAGNLAQLRTDGLIDTPGAGELILTAAGRAKADPDAVPQNAKQLQAQVLARVSAESGPQGRILQVLIEAYPEWLPTAEIARRVDVSPTSGSFAGNLGRLRSMGFMDRRPGMLRAAEVLFFEKKRKVA